MCLRLQEQCLCSKKNPPVARVAHVLLLRSVVGNMDVNTLASKCAELIGNAPIVRKPSVIHRKSTCVCLRLPVAAIYVEKQVDLWPLKITFPALQKLTFPCGARSRWTGSHCLWSCFWTGLQYYTSRKSALFSGTTHADGILLKVAWKSMEFCCCSGVRTVFLVFRMLVLFHALMHRYVGHTTHPQQMLQVRSKCCGCCRLHTLTVSLASV